MSIVNDGSGHVHVVDSEMSESKNIMTTRNKELNEYLISLVSTYISCFGSNLN